MTELKIIGIDEAGRGPLIGPLVVAGVRATSEELDKLNTLGIKDSKLIPPKKREELFSKIIDIVGGYEILIISSKEVDKAVESTTYNLNLLEEDNMIKIIERLYEKDTKLEAYIDCMTQNTDTLKNYVENKMNVADKSNIKIIPEHKADMNYIIVGAASILAKVTRDREIEKLKEKFGDFGSGYPSDKKTREFFKENIKLDIYRKSWKTYKNMVGDEKQKNLFDY